MLSSKVQLEILGESALFVQGCSWWINGMFLFTGKGEHWNHQK